MLDAPNSDLWCKICGVTAVEDAVAVASAGADAVGLNCYPPSPRFSTPERIAEICRAVELCRVAVFVDPRAAEVDRLLRQATIDLLQFHGDEDADFCAQFGVPYMKSVRMRAGVDVAAIREQHAGAWALLLDTYVPGVPGGTGARMDLALWPDIADCRLILAGGLTPANVGAAAEQVRPFGVDAAGGVEGATPGRKDPMKISEFITEARRVQRA